MTQATPRLPSDDFKRLCDGLRDGVALQQAGELIYVNRSLVGYLGYQNAKQLLGRSITEVLKEHEAGQLPGQLAALEAASLAGEGRSRLQVDLRRPDLPNKLFDLTIEASSTDAKDKLFITLSELPGSQEVRAALEHADRLASLGTLAAGVAHEINNPLAYVVSNLGYSIEQLIKTRSIFQSADLPDAVKDQLENALVPISEALEEAGEGTDRVARIVQSLKSFSRNEGEERGAVDLQTVLNSAISMSESEIRYRALLERNFGDIPLVDGNEARLVQVFVNLLVNAGQAIADGKPTDNRVVVRTYVQADGMVVAEISDTGAGIEKPMMDRIFDPFFTTKPIGVGTGLGLSICHGLIRGFGGRIEVESTVGEGSSFKVLLRPATRQVPRVTARAERPSTFRGELLIIDDEPLVLRAFRRTLSAHHNVAAVSDARWALEMIGKGKDFDLIFCDLMMPGMTGMDFHSTLRDEEPELAKRVVFLTGGAFTNKARDYLESVPNPALEKPLHPNALRSFVSKALV